MKLLFFVLILLSISFADFPMSLDDPGISSKDTIEVTTAYDGDGYLKISTGLSNNLSLSVRGGYDFENKTSEVSELEFEYSLDTNIAIGFTEDFSINSYQVCGIYGKAIGPINLDLNVGGIFNGDTISPYIGLIGIYNISFGYIGTEISGTNIHNTIERLGVSINVPYRTTIGLGIKYDTKPILLVGINKLF